MAQSKTKGLGKGLGALFGEIPPVDAAQPVTTLPIEQLEPNPAQPRRSFSPEELETLAESLREHGVISPLTVRKTGENLYQIIAGERRWRAARMAGLSELPVYCIEADDQTVMELALIENLQREDLNPIEEAQGYQTLMQTYGMTQETVADRVGKSRPAVANALRLLSLSSPLQELVKAGKLSAGHARALLPLSGPQQQTLAQRVIALQLSVRQTEALARQAAKELEPVPAPKSAGIEVNYLAECEKNLSRRLGRGVKIIQGKRKGRFELEFYNQEDLQQLLDALERLDFKSPGGKT